MVQGRGGSEISLIVGLGNPGNEYAFSRHNTGFMVIEKLLATLPAGRFVEENQASSRLFCGKYRGRDLLLQMPMTYMNLSGNAVGPLCGRFNLAPENILVIVDDMDLPVGRIRLRRNGSSGGHNGLKSIIEKLQSEKFNRLRIGIGRSSSKDQIDHVLGNFSGEEKKVFDESIDRAVEAIQCILKSGMGEAMNKFNSSPECRENPAEESNPKQ